MVVLLSPGFFAHFSRKKKSIRCVCVCLSLSLDFKKMSLPLYTLIYSHRERERKETFRQKLSSSASTKVVVVVPTKSQKSRFRFRRRLKCVVVWRRKEIVKGYYIISSIKGVVFWRLLIRCSKVFLVLVSFSLLFLLSLSLDWVVLFSYYFCLNPKPRRVFLKRRRRRL